MPYIKEILVPEIDSTGGAMWARNGYDNITLIYRFSEQLYNPQSNDALNWRIAFLSGVAAWNLTPIKIYLTPGTTNEQILLDMYYDPSDGSRGETAWTIVNPGNILVYAISAGNVYKDWEEHFTIKQRDSVAAHELGHAHGIGHVPVSDTLHTRTLPYIAIMKSKLYPEDNEEYYVPQLPDIRLVNQYYP
jgi:hypothetical protein